MLQFPEMFYVLLQQLDCRIPEQDDNLDEIDVGRLVLDVAEQLGVPRYMEANDLLHSHRLCYILLGELFRRQTGLVAPETARQGSLARVTVDLEHMTGNPAVAVQAREMVGYSDLANKTFCAEGMEVAEAVPLPAGERVAFARYVNVRLHGRPRLGAYLPLDEYGEDLFVRIRDGLLLAELMKLESRTVDELRLLRQVPDQWTSEDPDSVQDRTYNVQKVLDAGKSVGFALEGVEAADLATGNEETVINTLWKIIRTLVMGHVRTKGRPELKCLRQPDEPFDAWCGLSAEEVLRRWLAHHLGLAASAININPNAFPEMCLPLLCALDPNNLLKVGSLKSAMDSTDVARIVLEAAGRFAVPRYLEPNDLLVSERLCFLLLGELFRRQTGLTAPEATRQGSLARVTVDLEQMAGNPTVAIQASEMVGYSEFANKTFSLETKETAEAAPLPAGERVAFARYVNITLHGRPRLRAYLPLDEYGDDLFVRIRDGLLLAELMKLESNMVAELRLQREIPDRWTGEDDDCVRDRVQNAQKVLDHGKSAGFALDGCDAAELVTGCEETVISTLWAVIRTQVLGHIRTKGHPELRCLRQVDESFDAWCGLSAEEVLRRWLAHHLGAETRVTVDSNKFPEMCLRLLCALDTNNVLKVGTMKSGMDSTDVARVVLDAAEQLRIPRYLEPNDLLLSDKLCFMLLGELFRRQTGLVAPETARQGSLARVTVDLEHMTGNPAVAVQAREMVGYSDLANKTFCAEGMEVAEAVPLPAGERVAFARYVNVRLHGRPRLGAYLPLDEYGEDLFVRIRDGLLLAELMKLESRTVDELRLLRQVPDQWTSEDPDSVQDRTYNVQKVLDAGKSVGFALEGVEAADLATGNEETVINTLWKIIRTLVMGHVRTKGRPELKCLRQPDEPFDAWCGLSAEEVLRRWLAHHLGLAASAININPNAFPEMCLPLLCALDPNNLLKVGSLKSAMDSTDVARIVLEAAGRFAVPRYLEPNDLLVSERLCFLLLGELFRRQTGLTAPEATRQGSLARVTVDLEQMAGNPTVAIQASEMVGYSEFANKTFSLETKETAEAAPLPAGERVAFARYVNITLHGRPRLRAYLPLDEYGDDLFVRIRDGLLLAELMKLESNMVAELRLQREIPDRWTGEDDDCVRDRVQNAQKVLDHGMSAGFALDGFNALDLATGRYAKVFVLRLFF
jgi:methylphosphotriester-DNA--protein-cysteine methyltransferase